MKKRYKAKVVGLKWSPKHMSRYRPVFEYEDEYGEKRQYVRRKSMERTPFSELDSYTIIKTDKGTYEATERKLSNRFCFLCFKAFLLLVTICFPKTTLLTLLISSFATLIYFAAPGWIRSQIGKCNFKTEKIDGKITGYQKLKRRDENGNPLYRPIIEYNYNGNIYTHMSKTLCQLNQYGYLSTCEIFISNKKRIIYDIFEVSQPIIDIERWKTLFKEIHNASVDKDVKVYEPKTPVVNKTFKKSDTIPLNIPLKTLPYKKASGWY